MSLQAIAALALLQLVERGHSDIGRAPSRWFEKTSGRQTQRVARGEEQEEVGLRIVAR
jgi:hypothetical protein